MFLLLYNADDQELRRTLQSLACGNKKVLKKRPVGKDVNIGDVFYFNNDFTDPRQKVHINSIQSKETVRIFTHNSLLEFFNMLNFYLNSLRKRNAHSNR